MRNSFLRLGYAAGKSRTSRQAVFLGNIDDRVDQELVNQTARLLPDWTFDFYGPLAAAWQMNEANVHYRGPLAYDDISRALPAYSVGLIPFRELGGFMKAVERPLKFYEYISAGLGVACTDVGSMRSGMGGWARFGGTAEEFSHAIEQAQDSAAARSNDERIAFVRDNSWNGILQEMLQRLEQIMAGNEA
jgi:hypothetical protein